jgi:hypothetical protein
MNENKIYITIGHIEEFVSYDRVNVNDELKLKKDRDNRYDDEAIAVYDMRDSKVGYVANSVHSVARGTYSAGRLYEKMGDEAVCRVMFKTEEMAIAVVG